MRPLGEYMQSVKDQGKLSQFGITYIDMSSTLLQFVRATREQKLATGFDGYQREYTLVLCK